MEPFLQAPWVTEAKLTLQSSKVDLSGLLDCKSLTARLRASRAGRIGATTFPAWKTSASPAGAVWSRTLGVSKTPASLNWT